MAIEGRIAKIISEYEVIINKGHSDGVNESVRFVVYTEVDDVIDPDTGDSLGKWELVKGRLAPTHVQKRMTVCAADATGEAAAGGEPKGSHTLSAEMIAASMPRGGEGRLDVRKSDVSGVPAAKPIAVGDRVRSVG